MTMKQTTSKVLMVQPVRFGFNQQTADNNVFQKHGFEYHAQENALHEFTSYVSLLRANDIEVITVEDSPIPFTPDSIFPNNWFSTHEDGTLVLYPVFAPNRRNERKWEVLEAIRNNFDVRRIIDLAWWENEGLFLEGTGSMIFNRCNNIVYTAKSQRTSVQVLEDFCKKTDFTPVCFEAVDRNGFPIYHTNVMMSVGTTYAVICSESIRDAKERDTVLESLSQTGKKILEISYDQLEHFAGNMLELTNRVGKAILVMSATARKSLTPEQAKELSSHYKILSPQLDCIEMNGGGSARCMLAELF